MYHEPYVNVPRTKNTHNSQIAFCVGVCSTLDGAAAAAFVVGFSSYSFLFANSFSLFHTEIYISLCVCRSESHGAQRSPTMNAFQ